MLGIIGAMDKETGILFDSMADKRETEYGYSRFVRGTLEGVECVTARCGIGKVHAAVCAYQLIRELGADRVINIGVAGALEEKLGIADAVIASSAVQHDIDTSPIGDPVGLISGPNIVHIPCDERMTGLITRAAELSGIRSTVKAIVTGDRFVCGREDKSRLADLFGAAACDMEGGAIAQVCWAAGIPYAALRKVSDTLEGSGMEYMMCAELAGRASAKLLRAFLRLYREEMK